MVTRSINGGKWFVFYKDQVLVKSKDPSSFRPRRTSPFS